jgi:hypothetical protein
VSLPSLFGFSAAQDFSRRLSKGRAFTQDEEVISLCLGHVKLRPVHSTFFFNPIQGCHKIREALLSFLKGAVPFPMLIAFHMNPRPTIRRPRDADYLSGCWVSWSV